MSQHDQPPQRPDGEPDLSLAAQAVGYWTGIANRTVVRTTVDTLARLGLTQPGWWTLGQLAGAGGGLTPDELAVALHSRLEATGRDEGALWEALDGLFAHGWTEQAGDGRLVITEAGLEVTGRARQAVARLRTRMHEGVDDADYAAAVQVLRRIIGNLGGPDELPRIPAAADLTRSPGA